MSSGTGAWLGQGHGRTHDQHVLRTDVGGDRHEAHGHESHGNQGEITQQRRTDEPGNQQRNCHRPETHHPILKNEEDIPGKGHEHRRT